MAVTSKDDAAGDATRTVLRIDPAAREDVIGQRALTLDSVHNSNVYADLNAEDLLAQATQEGGTWRPGTVRWDTRKTSGFDQSQQADVFLRGHQVGYPITVAKSWLAGVGIRPLFSLIGGTIAYRRQSWVIDMHLAGWTAHGGGNATPFRIHQHPITWAEVDDRATGNLLRWRSAPAADTFHPTVTYNDLRHVGLGRGSTTIGPDQGFDL